MISPLRGKYVPTYLAGRTHSNRERRWLVDAGFAPYAEADKSGGKPPQHKPSKPQHKPSHPQHKPGQPPHYGTPPRSAQFYHHGHWYGRVHGPASHGDGRWRG